MNILPGRVLANGVVETKAGRLAFRRQSFNVEAGRDVDAGVRPEDFQYVPPGATDGGLAFDVEFVEDLGAIRLIHGMSGDTAIVVATAASSTAPSRSGARLIAEADGVHLFDQATGKSLRK